MNIFHYKKKSGEYKAFNMNPTDDNDAVFINMAQGVKNGNRDQIAMKANKQELAFFIMEATKLYNSLDDSESDYDKSKS